MTNRRLPLGSRFGCRPPVPELAEPAALFETTRARSQSLAAPLSPEDMVVQSMEDASPTKWHLAHTSWFFEEFVLRRFVPGYEVYDPRFLHCFNSYYVQAGSRHARPRRGLLTRPPVREVMDYRAHVDAMIAELVSEPPHDTEAEIGRLLTLGCHHEMQHQELLLTDLLHAFSLNPLEPAYKAPEPLAVSRDAPAPSWHGFEGGLVEIGHDGRGFSFDNEGPRHRVFLEPFRLAGLPVSCAEWIAFIDDGGYETETLWLSDGWACRQREGWTAPLYWSNHDGDWWVFGLRGAQAVDPNAPVAHVSYYEADAFARWAGRRLPTEAEWEHAARSGARVEDGRYLEGEVFRPRPPAAPGDGLRLMAGEVWQWTQSAYTAYPGFKPVEGAIGEYNGKFMVNQWTLRGASCATPKASVRPSYRNFFPPHARWQFSGLRLADGV